MHIRANERRLGTRDWTQVEPQHVFSGTQEDRVDAKKKSFLYAERNALQRAQFLEQLSHITPQDRVYADEAGAEDTLAYAWGWSPCNIRCLGERLGHRTKRVSMAAAWCQGQLLSPMTFEGYCDAPLIEAWFEQLIRELRPGQTVILDNASFHRMKTLRQILARVGCFLLPLPAYSPDLNKIEPQWNHIKRKIAFDQTPNRSFRDKVDAAFL